MKRGLLYLEEKRRIINCLVVILFITFIIACNLVVSVECFDVLSNDGMHYNIEIQTVTGDMNMFSNNATSISNDR